MRPLSRETRVVAYERVDCICTIGLLHRIPKAILKSLSRRSLSSTAAFCHVVHILSNVFKDDKAHE